MAIRADRVGVREDQVDIHGRVTSPSFLNELLEDLPEWTDMPVWVNGTEELLPSNNSVPVTSPILTDIAYPDIRRDNQYFTYRESPTPVDGLAKIKSIKGNTLVWNQLVQNGNFANTSLWGAVRGSISASNNVLSYTFTELGGGYLQNRLVQTLPTYANRKYFVSVTVKAEKPTALMADVAGEFWLREEPMTPNVWNVFQAIRTGESNKPNFVFGCPSNIGDMAIGDVVQFKNVMLIDLTQMFGSGNEPSTVEDITSLFPLSYYSYNQGSLLSFNGNGIKTVGKNLASGISQGAVDIHGGTTSNEKRLRVDGFVRVFQGDHYTFTATSNSGKTLQIYTRYFADANGSEQVSYLDWLNLPRSVIIPSGVNYATFTIRFGNNDNITLNDISDVQIEHGTSATSYEPYTSSTLSLPISTYFPTGMKSAGTVYDELTPRKAITRIGAVDLGSLNWVYVSADALHPLGYFYSTSLVGQKANGELNMSCGIYQTIMSWSVDKSVKGNANNYTVYIVDTSYTDATTFKTAMSGVYLYYELATPVELPTMSFE